MKLEIPETSKKNLFKIGQKWAIILRKFIFWENAEQSENALKRVLMKSN